MPAGFVIADPMTLTDPVLFVREHILGLGPADPKVRPPDDATDLRLGAAHGSLALLLDDDAEIYRRVRGGEHAACAPTSSSSRPVARRPRRSLRRTAGRPGRHHRSRDLTRLGCDRAR